MKSPLIIRKILLLLLTFFLMTPSIKGQDFYSDLNQIRKKRGLRSLSVDSSLVKSCERLLIRNKGMLVHSVTTYGEVLAKNTDDVLQAWLDSKPHRKTLLKKRYRYIGMAKKDECYCARLR